MVGRSLCIALRAVDFIFLPGRKLVKEDDLRGEGACFFKDSEDEPFPLRVLTMTTAHSGKHKKKKEEKKDGEENMQRQIAKKIAEKIKTAQKEWRTWPVLISHYHKWATLLPKKNVENFSF